jgi:hypothetical protein
MLRKFGVLAVLGLALATAARAEKPEPLIPSDGDVYIAVGRAETFQFKTSFQTINVLVPGIVQATAQTDRTVTFLAQAEGETLVLITTPDGRQVYSARFIVTQEPGHVVKIYGPSAKDYVGVYCTETTCGRADKELGGARDPASTSVTTRRPMDGGGFVEKTTGYGR